MVIEKFGRKDFWRFMGVYGWLETSMKLKICDLLKDFSSYYDLLWFVGGDFNEVFYNYEEKKRIIEELKRIWCVLWCFWRVWFVWFRIFGLWIYMVESKGWLLSCGGEVWSIWGNCWMVFYIFRCKCILFGWEGIWLFFYIFKDWRMKVRIESRERIILNLRICGLLKVYVRMW